MRDTWVSFALIVACLLIALALLGGNISHLANIVEDNPKVKTIKFVTVFNAVCFLGVVAIIILSITGTIQLTDSSKTMIASAITSLVILVLGNLCPKLPYSRHTGLRLPWTLADESTWILAHRILGYTAIPFGISNIIAMFSFQAPNIREGFAIGTFCCGLLFPLLSLPFISTRSVDQVIEVVGILFYSILDPFAMAVYVCYSLNSLRKLTTKIVHAIVQEVHHELCFESSIY